VEEIVIQPAHGTFSPAEVKRLGRDIAKTHPLIETRVEGDALIVSGETDTVVLWTPWTKDDTPRRAEQSMRAAVGWARGRASRSGLAQRIVMMGADSKLLQALELAWPDRSLSAPSDGFKPPTRTSDPRRGSVK
jgi:hypothetical protein